MNELLLFLTLLEKNNCDELTFLHESNRAEWIVQICFALTPVSRKRNDVKIYQEKAFRYWVEKHVWKEAHDGGGLLRHVPLSKHAFGPFFKKLVKLVTRCKSQ